MKIYLLKTHTPIYQGIEGDSSSQDLNILGNQARQPQISICPWPLTPFVPKEKIQTQLTMASWNFSVLFHYTSRPQQVNNQARHESIFMWSSRCPSWILVVLLPTVLVKNSLWEWLSWMDSGQKLLQISTLFSSGANHGPFLPCCGMSNDRSLRLGRGITSEQILWHSCSPRFHLSLWGSISRPFLHPSPCPPTTSYLQGTFGFSQWKEKMSMFTWVCKRPSQAPPSSIWLSRLTFFVHLLLRGLTCSEMFSLGKYCRGTGHYVMHT